MDYHSMSLVELKQVAKEHTPKIKQYYIKSRLELIQILSMKQLPEEMILSKKTITELRKEAKERGHTNIWKLKRSELVELLYPSANKHNKNDNHTEKHNDPQKSEGKDRSTETAKNELERIMHSGVQKTLNQLLGMRKRFYDNETVKSRNAMSYFANAVEKLFLE
jgi:hypothetical protein